MTTIDTTVGDIFATCPELFGFSVGQIGGELCLSDVETDPRLVKSEELLGNIAAALNRKVRRWSSGFSLRKWRSRGGLVLGGARTASDSANTATTFHDRQPAQAKA